MNLNSIPTDRSLAPQASPVPNGGGESFQVAYAKVFDGRYLPDVALERTVQTQPGPVQPAKTAHTIHAGETLTGIARARLATLGAAAGAGALRDSVAQLAKANNIRNPDRIFAGQKLDLAVLDAAFGRHQAAATPAPAASALRDAASSFQGSERIATHYEIVSPAQWHQEDWMPADEVQVVAGAPAQLAAATPVSPPVSAQAEMNAAIAPLPPIDPMAARQVALYEQNAAAALEKPAEPARALPDIVYKGIAGKLLDAVPIEPSTRATLERANTIVSSAFTARSLGALTGLGGPLLTVAGLLWGVFSSRQSEAAADAAAKPADGTNPVVGAKQTTPAKVAGAPN